MSRNGLPSSSERTGLLGRQHTDNDSISDRSSATTSQNAVDFPNHEADESSKTMDYRTNLTRNLALLLSVYLVNSDSSILLAMFRQVASEFDQMQNSSWIINAYIIGSIVAMPMYGKLSDIFGRKYPLMFAYCCYFLGSILAGIGFSFAGVLLGRTLAGVGSSGVAVLVSTLIVDLVPMRDVAVWRSYVYALNQAGRALGPPIGGLIADHSDWRWSLTYQTPLLFLIILVVGWKMTDPRAPEREPISGRKVERRAGLRAKVMRIDFGGSLTLAIANSALVLFLNDATQDSIIVQNPRGIASMVVWLVFLLAFLVVEGLVAPEPVLPLRLLSKRNVFSAYIIQFLQAAAQVALFASLPLYFQVTLGDTTTRVALRLAIVTLGTIVGGLISGWFIRSTGKFRLVIILSLLLSNISLIAIYLRWRGHTGWAETLYGLPVGLGFGVSLSAAFIGLTSRLDASLTAISTSGFYLSLNLGSLLGVSISSLLIVKFVKRELLDILGSDDHARKIIEGVLSNIKNIDGIGGQNEVLVRQAYVDSLVTVWLFALTCGLVSLVMTPVMQEGMSPAAKAVRNEGNGYGTLPRSSEQSETV